jgi:magnesium-transporting ATPase (P-type)
MASLYEVPEENKYKLFVKGGPDVLISKCSTIFSKQKSLDLTNDIKLNLERVQEEYAEAQQRTLVICQMEVDSSTFKTLAEKHKNELTKNFFEELIGKKLQLIALVGIVDPYRKDVPDAIKKCKLARVLVRMVTGDFIKTAIAIAKEIKILTETEAKESMVRVKHREEAMKSNLNPFEEDFSKNIYALEGPEFRKLCGGYTEKTEGKGKDKVVKRFLTNPEIFRKVTQNLRVIARASPDDKFLLVLGLKELGNTVAVTGDGTNDAPALNISDVGFSMGIRGTDIAKAVSDIVLQDDSFSSIITAIKYGRNVYDCIRKFLQFQLTTNVVAVFMTLLGGVILNDAPLNAIQMLWVNLIMDSFASLALATESPKESLLNRKPYPKTDYIITPYMMVNIISQAVFQIVVLTAVIFYGDVFFGVPSDRELSHYAWNDLNGYHFTVFFNIFVFLQVFNSINARKLGKADKNVLDGILDNYLYLGVQLFIVFGQVLMVQLGGRAVRTRPLTVYQHLWCMAIGASCLILSLIVKFLPYGEEEEDQYVEDSGLSWIKSVKKASKRTRNTNKTIPIQVRKKNN